MLSFFGEFATFMKTRKRYWLMPVVVVVILFGVLLVMTQGTAISTLLYTLF
jgi:uncharacterized membrane protein YjdF